MHYLQVVQMMEYFIWVRTSRSHGWSLSWGRTSRIHWSRHDTPDSVEISVSSHLIYFLLEFIRLKFRIFDGGKTIVQQISALSGRLGAKRVAAAWCQESLVTKEANGTIEMVSLFHWSDTTKGMKLQQTAAEWNDEELRISSSPDLL